MNRATNLPLRSTSPAMLRHLGHLAPARSIRVPPEVLAGCAVLALASVSLIGSLAVLLFVASTAAILATQPLFNLRQLVRFSPLLLFPLLATISTVWSDAPERTMRAALELFLTFVAAIVIARNIRPHKLVLVLFVSYLILALSTLPDVPLAIATKFPLVSHFGSKNVVGYAGYALFALSVAVLADPLQPSIIRVGSIACMPLGLLLGYLAQSGGTTSSLVLTMIIFPPLAFLALLKLPVRLVLVALALLLLSVAAVYLNDIEQAIDQFRTGVLNKDTTLTGRTYLWDFAARLSAVRPYLGYGYSAFWRQGNIDAEGLWRWGGIAGRGGFNFHNAFVGCRVDLGLVGVVLLAATCITIGVAALARQILRPTVAFAALISLVAVDYVRSYVEEGLIAPFGLSTLVLLATGVYALAAMRAPDTGTDQRGSRNDKAFGGAMRSSNPADRRSALFKSGERR